MLDHKEEVSVMYTAGKKGSAAAETSAFSTKREQGCRETHSINTAACNASQIPCRPARLFPMGAMYRSMDW
jgi:hypothetical protein